MYPLGSKIALRYRGRRKVCLPRPMLKSNNARGPGNQALGHCWTSTLVSGDKLSLSAHGAQIAIISSIYTAPESHPPSPCLSLGMSVRRGRDCARLPGSIGQRLNQSGGGTKQRRISFYISIGGYLLLRTIPANQGKTQQ